MRKHPWAVNDYNGVTHMTDFSKIRSATVRFCDGLAVDGFELPDGSYWVSITSSSEVLGYAKNWLGRNLSKGGNTFKALQGHGFSGYFSEVVTPSMGGDQKSKLISLKDFNRLILFAASKGKTEAVALADALLNMSMVDFFRETFGQRQLSIEEKRRQFYLDYSASLTRDDWLEMDRIEVKVINDQLRFVGES